MMIHFRGAASPLLEAQVIICAVGIIAIASLLALLRLLAKQPSTAEVVRRLRASGREVDALRSLFSSIVVVPCPKSRGQMDVCLIVLRYDRKLLALVDAGSSPLTGVQRQAVDELCAVVDEMFRLARQTSGPGSDGWPAIQRQWSETFGRGIAARKAILDSLRSSALTPA